VIPTSAVPKRPRLPHRTSHFLTGHRPLGIWHESSDSVHLATTFWCRRCWPELEVPLEAVRPVSLGRDISWREKGVVRVVQVLRDAGRPFSARNRHFRTQKSRKGTYLAYARCWPPDSSIPVYTKWRHTRYIVHQTVQPKLHRGDVDYWQMFIERSCKKSQFVWLAFLPWVGRSAGARSI
jgi:hypothetical protein